jgi:hypothetical protein
MNEEIDMRRTLIVSTGGIVMMDDRCTSEIKQSDMASLPLGCLSVDRICLGQEHHTTLKGGGDA